MQLQTIVDIPESEWKIGHQDSVLMLGSCFADEVGERMRRAGFQVEVNPFGTLYNPASIAALLLHSIGEREYDMQSPEVFQDSVTGAWHSWMHHTRFSSPSREELINRANATLHHVGNVLRSCNVLVITLGTAIIYRLQESGMLVANCHKQPDRLFLRQPLTAYDIQDQWGMLLQLLQSINPQLRIILTVSPIRHRRDGLHTNQVSKGILLQAVDGLCQQTDSVQYFPSYEIMMDELRDYRFYADDLVHPSTLAVEYIWERFQRTYMSPATVELCRQKLREWTRSQHRPLVR